MTYQAILIASIFLLLAFGVERLGRTAGIPSAILLIATGLAGKPVLASFGLALEGIGAAVPIVGTLGLILIVLEGALDIKLRRDRLRAASSGFLMAFGGLVSCAALFTLVAYLALDLTLHQSAVLAVPFAVISSTIAIPSSGFLPPWGREFVIYESSFSDILGVLVFFSLLNSDGTLGGALMGLIGGGVLSLFLAVICAVGLVLILMRIDGHIRFTPLLAGLFGLYAAGKLMHLSPLILVLLFGLMLNNPGLIVRLRPFRGWLDEQYETTLEEFKLLILELTFAVRGFFFILLGYWTDLMELVSLESWLSALLVLAVVYGSRYVMLRVSRFDLLVPLTCIAPRGLITVLLFLAAKEAVSLPHFLYGTVMLVVLVSATMITVGRYRLAAADAATASSRGQPSEST
ncbi:cation:proton antiporter [Propionivibrio sp.]|uniref:cation:proton antiporter domain-containing protein n=1 Tax=Propionivibrio sp. TaxID=2212460 RepID=UPI0025E3E6D6|nr:cation:proton antiporter [Propionivibrio sp.]MBK7357349.1 sodium:proton antiporter [Propionivibrio sp.]MBK8401247.1 sodium:proton antiporter [Propionivibrio sp.]MBK8743197.1 sodium:proton antiporter [Propionivibrio sp.]MBK8894798.1 sodium:proton antiporter [Propionivibrio sp.]MBL0208988.1 sodium:proton antiporter [Propionivibrio sp.]